MIAQLREIWRFGSIAFIAHVEVDDEQIQNFRRSLPNPRMSGTCIAATNVGYLASKSRWLEVNLAGEKLRAPRIAAMIELIKGSGLPYLDRFHRPQEIVASLLKGPNPGMLEIGEVEYAVFCGGHDAGRRVLERCFKQWPKSEGEYRAALREYREKGLPSAWPGKAGPRLAMASLSLRIET
jgi:hypothetical protein